MVKANNSVEDSKEVLLKKLAGLGSSEGKWLKSKLKANEPVLYEFLKGNIDHKAYHYGFTYNAKSVGKNIAKQRIVINGSNVPNYFCNALDASVDKPPLPASMDNKFIVFTLEHDPDIAEALPKLQEQLAYIYKHAERLYSNLCSYDDFRGLYIVYSGNKSIHYHMVFASTQIALRFKQAAAANIKAIYKNAYIELSGLVCAHYSKTTGANIEFDSSMGYSQYRRLDGAVRKFSTRDKHFTKDSGIKELPQANLYSKARSKAKISSNKNLIKFDLLKCINNNNLNASTNVTPQVKNAGFAVYLKTVFAKQYKGKHLMFSHLSKDGTTAYFFNNKSDVKPTSCQTWDKDKILVYSKNDALKAELEPLQQQNSFKLTLARHYAAYQNDNAIVNPVNIEEDVQDVLNNSGLSNREKLTAIIKNEIEIDKNDVSIISAPEGIGKTTAILNNLDSIFSKYGKLVMAFKNNDLALEKYNEFKGKEDNVEVVLLESPSRLLHSFDVNITYKQLLASGFKGYYDLFSEYRKHGTLKGINNGFIIKRYDKKLQQIAECLFGELGKIRKAEEEGKRLVILYTQAGLENISPNQIMGKLFAEYKISLEDALVIYDELSVDDIITYYKAIHVDFYDEYKELESQGFNKKDIKENMAKQYQSILYKKYLDMLPELEKKREYLEEHKPSKIAGDTEYGNGVANMYELPLKGYLCPNKSLISSKYKVIVLTTERLCIEVANSINSKLDKDDKQYRVNDLSELNNKSGECEVKIDKNCKRENIGQLFTNEDFKKLYGTFDNIHYITNYYKDIDVKNCISHQAAKGSNHLCEYNIISTITYLSLAEFEKISVIASYLNIPESLAMYKADSLNQTLGRNLGYRFNALKFHHLYIGSKLYCSYFHLVSKYCRYKLKLV